MNPHPLDLAIMLAAIALASIPAIMLACMPLIAPH
jgi:hypothetical protein